MLPWPTIGGIEVATLRVAEAAREKGFEAVAYCPGPDCDVAVLFRERGFEIAQLERVEPSVRRPVPFLRESVRIASDLKRRRIELMHCSDILAAYYAGVAGRMRRIPVLSHVRNRYSDLPAREKAYLRPVQHFAFVSQDTWRTFALHVAQKKGSVIYDGVTQSAPMAAATEFEVGSVRSELGIEPDETVIGMVARVAPQKDYFTLIQAAVSVLKSQAKCRFVIIGDHSGAESYRMHYAEVKAALVEAGIADRFLFTGFRSDTQRLLRALDVFVLSTHVEGFPLVLLEAMEQALPVVATRVDGVPEIIHDGQTGLLHEHLDSQGLANALIAVIQDRSLGERLGRNGQTLARTEFSQERFATSVAELYNMVLLRYSRSSLIRDVVPVNGFEIPV